MDQTNKDLSSFGEFSSLFQKEKTPPFTDEYQFNSVQFSYVTHDYLSAKKGSFLMF